MLHTSIAPTVATPLPSDRSRDYELIRRAIAFLSETWAEQPSLDRLADHLQLSPAHCQKLFKRWCGLEPQGVRAGHHRRPRARPARRLGQRARRRLRGGPLRRQPAARPVRLARGHDAWRLQAPRRGAGDGLRLPCLAVRRGAADRHRARAGRPRLRRRGQRPDAAGRAGRHDAALAQGALRRGAGQDRAACAADLRRARRARTSRCGSS